MCTKLIYLVYFILLLGLVLAGGAKAADPNLLGWWPLNEGSGDIAVDLSGRGNDGTINNPNGGLGPDGSVWVDDPERGTVISFNGTANGAYVRAGYIPQMTLTNDFTWAFWAKQDAGNTTPNDIIFGNRKDDNAADFVPRQFIKFTPTKFEWHMNGNGNDNLEYDDIPAEVWLHHAVVKTADQLTYYRNGIEDSSGTFTQPLDLPQPLFFGGDNENAEGENWRGLMSDARIYNRALTRLEILAAMEGVEQIDMEIGYAPYPPVLDGEVDGIWADASTQSFVPMDDPTNASGSWKVLYDAENLYVIVDMIDDSLQNDSSSSWQDDSVEIYFDGGNTKVSTPLSGDDHQYTFGWTTDDIQGTNITGYTEGIEHAQVTTDTGWRIEVKMPWLSIWGVVPQAGDLIGIDCYYNDDDDGGNSRENKLLSFSAVEGWNDASQWGTAILTADKRVDVTAPGDAIQGVPNDGDWPSAETPDLAIDDNIETKYLHFKGDFDPDPGTGGTGFQVTPAAGPTTVTGLTLTTANDVPGRDPIAFELSGSNEGIDGPYELIASGDVVDFAQEAEWPRFTMNATPISFKNDKAYAHYQLIFTAIRGPVGGSVNSMQIAEVELLGVLTPAGLMGHWTLDEGFGTTAYDSSGNGNDGTIVGNPTWIAGVMGTALEFHGLGAAGGGGDYIDCGNDASLDIPGPISIALWIRPGADDPEGKGTETAPMAKAMSGMSPSWSWQVRYGWGSPQPYMAFTFNTSPRAWVYVGRNLERDEWCHIACSHDGTILRCYLNGEQTDSIPMVGQITSSNTPVLIGSDGWGCDWIGAIDDVRIYNRALSDLEILYLAGF